jgi:hypothetical protein
MKKLATFVFAILLGASLSFAQATGGSPGKSTETPKTSGKKATKTKTKKGHKGGKKGKKQLNPQPLPPKPAAPNETPK